MIKLDPRSHSSSPAFKAPQRRGMSAMLRRLAQRRAAHALSALALGAALATHAQAANTVLYWDADGSATTATGGTGVWDLSTALWRNGSATGALQLYDNTTPSAVTADFGGTAGTVTLGSGLTINVNTIVFDTGGYTIAGASGSALNLTGTTPTITNNVNGGIQKISAKITGTVGFTQTGNNFTIFSGDLTGLTGTVNVNGRINLQGATLTGSQNQTWNIASGQNLTSNNPGGVNGGSTIQLGALSGAGTLRPGNDNTTGVSGTDTFQVGALNTSTVFSGAITDFTSGLGGTALGALTKVGTGTLTLSGANTYTGATTITGGTLQVGNGGTTGSLGSTSNVVDNGALIFNLSNTFQTAANNPVISGSGTITQAGTGTVILTGANTNTGTTFINSGTLQISAAGTSATLGSGNVVDNAALVFNRVNANTVANIISGTGSVAQTGVSAAGILTLTGANTYTGATIVNSGVLATATLAANGTASGIGAGTAVTLSGGGTLRYTGAASVTDGNFNRAITVGTGGGTLDNASGGGRFIFVNGSFTGAGALNLVDSSNSNDQFLVTGNSAGLSGNVTVGTATANSGFAQYRSNAANPFGTGTITVNAGGTLAADNGATAPSTLGNALILNGGKLGTQTPDMTYTGTINLAATSSVGNQQTGTTGNVTLSGVVSGAGGLTKTSADTVTLSNANTYTGTTTVNAGTLALNTSGTDATNATAAIVGAVTVNGAGTLGASAASTGQGVLQLAQSNQIANAAAVTLGGGTFNANGLSEGAGGATPTQGLGVLSVTTSTGGFSFLDFGPTGTGSNTLAFANSSGAGAFASQLQVLDYQYDTTLGAASVTDHLYFGVDATGLNPTTQLAQVFFVNPTGLASGTYSATQLSNGEIVPNAIAPTPEPGGIIPIVIGIAGLGALVARRRRRGTTEKCQNELAEAA